MTLADPARDRARAGRGASMMLLAALCVPLWLLSDWPGRFAARHRGLTAVAWAIAAFVAIVVVLRRRSWWRQPPAGSGGACATAPEEED